MKTKKTFLTIIFLATNFLPFQLVKAQFPIDAETGQVKFTAVIELPGIAKDKIYNKAKLWVTSTLKSSDNIIDLSTPDLIVATGNILLDSIRVSCKTCFAENAALNFKFLVFCKDGKYKYSLENFILHYSYVGNTREIGLDKINEVAMGKTRQAESIVYVKRKIDTLIAYFISSMKKEENNNW